MKSGELGVHTYSNTEKKKTKLKLNFETSSDDQLKHIVSMGF